jgi:hypothetical protein
MRQYRPMFGPLWVDPNYLHRYGWPAEPWGYHTRTVTTTRRSGAQPVGEERIREIVRQEIAGLPIPFDVPDSLPETEES